MGEEQGLNKSSLKQQIYQNSGGQVSLHLKTNESLEKELLLIFLNVTGFPKK